MSKMSSFSVLNEGIITTALNWSKACCVIIIIDVPIKMTQLTNLLSNIYLILFINYELNC